MLPLALLLSGAVLFGTAQFARSDVTPVGQMDCGCGGGNNCVTKRRAADYGLLLMVSGGILMGVGALGVGVQVYRGSKAEAGA